MLYHPLAEGAFVIDRVGVYLLNKTGAYSKVVAENGAFYHSYSETGEELAAPVDELSLLPDGMADTIIQAKWDSITSCTATLEMLNLPPAGA